MASSIWGANSICKNLPPVPNLCQYLRIPNSSLCIPPPPVRLYLPCAMLPRHGIATVISLVSSLVNTLPITKKNKHTVVTEAPKKYMSCFRAGKFAPEGQFRLQLASFLRASTVISIKASFLLARANNPYREDIHRRRR